MTAAVEWGPEIRVDEKRPAWLADDDRIQWSWGGPGRWLGEGRPASDYGDGADWEGIVVIRLPADHPYYAKPAATPEIAPALVERMVALVRTVAGSDRREPQIYEGEIAADWEAEARAIAAELPQPVDPDLVEARRIIIKHDDSREDAVLAGIKLGRALAAAECGLSGGEVGK